MTGKNLDDLTPQEQTAYQAGVDDTHERYAAMQAQASEWLTGVLTLIAKYESRAAVDAGLPSGARWAAIADELRACLPVGDLPLACEDRDTDSGLLCTRGTGHPGEHVAEPNGVTW